MKRIWIPQPNEQIKWHNKLWKIISVDMGGKCKIKKNRKTLIVDVSELISCN